LRSEGDEMLASAEGSAPIIKPSEANLETSNAAAAAPSRIGVFLLAMVIPNPIRKGANSGFKNYYS